MRKNASSSGNAQRGVQARADALGCSSRSVPRRLERMVRHVVAEAFRLSLGATLILSNAADYFCL